MVKIGILLGRQGVVVAERTLYRFAAERGGAGGKKVTTPVETGRQVVSYRSISATWADHCGTVGHTKLAPHFRKVLAPASHCAA